MINIISIIIVIIYSLALLLIFIYSLGQLHLLINFLRYQNKNENAPQFDLSKPNEIPYVTIQLPVFNELYVMERLLENISKIEYPKDKLEIQVLDDSTDESVDSTAKLIKDLQTTGLDISHIRRKNREGFKAGALKDGLAIAKGDYIAIFDADFLPKIDWLMQTVGYFKDPKIGVVQTRWGHINRDYSILTKIQAFALDVHFTIEQLGRNSQLHFINFNGTAGIWRKSCIIDAGNWESNTLTEDLDLSYRAQVKHWKFKYLIDVETPAELPVALSAARTQQFRWNKGGAENFMKNVKRLLSSKDFPISTKIHGFLHLLNSTMFLCMLTVSILSVIMLFIKNTNKSLELYFQITTFFFITTIILFICYGVAYKKTRGMNLLKFFDYIITFVTFFTIALGFALQNSIAVLEGFIGKKSEFVRTPKFNINGIKDKWKGNKYITKKFTFRNVLEFLLMLYFMIGIYLAYHFEDYGLLPFHVMLFIGYTYVNVQSLTSEN